MTALNEQVLEAADVRVVPESCTSEMGNSKVTQTWNELVYNFYLTVVCSVDDYENRDYDEDPDVLPLQPGLFGQIMEVKLLGEQTVELSIQIMEED